MSRSSLDDAGAAGDRQRRQVELIPRDFLRIVAVWSLIPSYTIAGGFIGYVIDRWAGWFPYLTAACLLIALVMAVRDMNRLAKEL
jgi:hypothetical protein